MYHAFRSGLDTAMKELGVDHSTGVDIRRRSPRNVTDSHYCKASLTQMRKVLEQVEATYKAVEKLQFTSLN